MIEFWNVVAAAIVSFILGLIAHSAYLHSKKRGELKRKHPWDHEEVDEQ